MFYPDSFKVSTPSDRETRLWVSFLVLQNPPSSDVARALVRAAFTLV